jgi:glycosyltransferase involved in cell wall biosynthesis
MTVKPVETGNRGRIGIVPTRFGAGVMGGAEAVLTEVAHGLAARGWEVDVLTTAARDHYTWANEFPEGETIEGGLRVTRFATVVGDSRLRDRLGNLILSGSDLGIEDQYRWINSSVRSPGLYAHLSANADRYRALIFAPYMFWTTLACSELASDRSILLPCLHDEPTARLDIFRGMFEGCRGLWVHTVPERDLVGRLFRVQRVALTGSGIELPTGYEPEAFRRRYGLPERFALYAGRREWGKAWPELVANLDFANTVLNEPLPLVTIGGGDTQPKPLVGRHFDLGFVTDQERSDAMAAATIYLQPSALESFSRTIMEAWVAGTPVVASAGSAVVRWHCETSGGGLLYQDRYEFAEALRALLEEPDRASELAAAGRSYVHENYLWPAVLDRMEQTLEAWT